MPIERMYPPIEALLSREPVTCPQCSITFKTGSNLKMHLAKTHKQPQLLERQTERVFHCPDTTCPYHKDNSFTLLKRLKQHYLKSHSVRNFECFTCNQTFTTERNRNTHAEYCNVVFKCLQCSNQYFCYETLKTHCRRKKHSMHDKATYKELQVGCAAPDSSDSCDSASLNFRQIQPKPMSTETSSQTEKLGLEVGRRERMAVETQTTAAFRPSVSPDLDELSRSSSATQTNITRENYSTHTDTSDLLFDPNYFNCHMETQTDLLNDTLFSYCEDYSNMYTQTCDDLIGSSDFCISAHTQTVFDDVLKSVESQTVLVSQSTRTTSALSCKRQSNMETQTELECQQMMHEINV